MGWLTGWDSKKELLAYLESNSFYAEGYKALKHSTVGNDHWTLLEKPDGTITIALEMISGRGGEWGFKSMLEWAGPTSLSCPIGFLNQASEPENDWAREWRERVRQHHQSRRERPAYQADQVWCVFGKNYRLTKKASGRRGWLGVRVEDGEGFRLPFRYLSKATLVEAQAGVAGA